MRWFMLLSAYSSFSHTYPYNISFSPRPHIIFLIKLSGLAELSPTKKLKAREDPPPSP